MLTRQDYNCMSRIILFFVLAAVLAVGWGWIGLQKSYAGTDPTYGEACIDGNGEQISVEASRDLHDGALDSSFSNWFINEGTTVINHRMEVRGGGDVHLIVRGATTLTAKGGIRVAKGTTLHVHGQPGAPGQLHAQAQLNEGCAGIGGNPNGHEGGDIVIESGEVFAYGGKSAAGIGGTEDHGGGTITINGGKVFARGGKFGAGIGGGEAAHGPGIVINGGEIQVQGGHKAAGIGGGQKYRGGGSGGDITINGGKLDVTGGNYGAGIGGGEGGSGGDITINGGTIKTVGGENSAGIGGGDAGRSGNIRLNGGSINAEGGDHGAGIGSGQKAGIDWITVEGSPVINAKAGRNGGAGIGSGYKGKGGTIVIAGGNIENAKGYEGGAGIGSGSEGNAVDIRISGGSIYARGSVAALYFDMGWRAVKGTASAAIGGGYKVSGGIIRITGGFIVARRETSGACCIGHGGGLDPEFYSNRSGFSLDWPEATVRSAVRCKKEDRDKTAFDQESGYFWDDAAYVQISGCEHPADWQTDDNQHWRECPYCLADTRQKSDHSFEWKIEGHQHLQKCKVCGYERSKGAHKYKDETHSCSECGVSMQPIAFKLTKDAQPAYLDGCIQGNPYQLPDCEKLGIEAPEGTVLYGWQVNNSDMVNQLGESIDLGEQRTLTARFTYTRKAMNDMLKKGGPIRMEHDIMLSQSDAPLSVPAGISVTLDLNGHRIQRTGRIQERDDGNFFDVSGNLTMEDSAGGGEICLGFINDDEKPGGGAVLVNKGGSFTMNGGTFKDNRTLSVDSAGAIAVNGGTFIMNGGSIAGNEGGKAGAVYACNGARVELRGGMITKNRSTHNSGKGEPGAAVYMEDAGNKAKKSTLLASGAPLVRENTAYINRESNIRLAEKAPIRIDGKLAVDANLGIHPWGTASGKVTVTEGAASNANPNHFYNDDPAWAIGIGSGSREIILGKDIAQVNYKEGSSAQEAKKGNSSSAGPAFAQAADTSRSIRVVKGEYYMLPPCTDEPPEGKVFDSWRVGNKDGYKPYEIVAVPGDTDVEPVWRDVSSGMNRVIVVSDEHGTAMAGVVEAEPGQTDIELLADPDNSYRFAGWKIEKGSATIKEPADFMTTFKMGSGEVRLRAVFEPIQMEGIELMPSNLVLEEGESVTINAIPRPYDAPECPLNWNIAHTDTATLKVNEKGSATITGVAAGMTELLITSDENENISVVRDVRVEHKALTHVAARKYTSTKPGNIEYWHCKVCGRYYADKEGYQEISKEDTQVTCPEEQLEYLQTDEFYAKAEKAIVKKTKITSVKAKKSRKAIVKWKKTSGISGYHITYSTDKKMKKNVKTKNVKASAKKVTLTKLKKGKRYYVQVRPFRDIKYPADGEIYRIYGQKSAKKSVRIR